MQTRSKTRECKSLLEELLETLPAQSGSGDFLLVLTPTRHYNVTREDDGSYAWEYCAADHKRSCVNWSNQVGMQETLAKEEILCYWLEVEGKCSKAVPCVPGKSYQDLVKAFYQS
jgi:hypothetical protein